MSMSDQAIIQLGLFGVAVVSLLGTIASGVLTYKMAQLNLRLAEVKATAVKIEEKVVVQDAKITQTAAAVEVIHKATNSMAQRMVDQAGAVGVLEGGAAERVKTEAVSAQLAVKTEAEALARGALDERARADAEKRAREESAAALPAVPTAQAGEVAKAAGEKLAEDAKVAGAVLAEKAKDAGDALVEDVKKAGK